VYGIARATGIRINQSIADAIAAYIIYRLGIKTSDKSSLDLKPKDIAILKAIPSFEMELKRIKKTHRQEKTKHQPPPSNVISIGAVASSSPARGTNTSSSGALHIVSPFKSSGTEFSVNADIHGVGKRLEAARARLSGLEHSELLLKFLDHLESLGLSKARVLKYANHLSKIFRHVAFDPSAATKHDVERWSRGLTGSPIGSGLSTALRWLLGNWFNMLNMEVAIGRLHCPLRSLGYL